MTKTLSPDRSIAYATAQDIGRIRAAAAYSTFMFWNSIPEHLNIRPHVSNHLLFCISVTI